MLPGVAVSAPPLTEKDIRDVEFGIELGMDAVALSFVRRSSDVDALRQALREHESNMPVIAKIEKPEAVRDIGAVLRYVTRPEVSDRLRRVQEGMSVLDLIEEGNP